MRPRQNLQGKNDTLEQVRLDTEAAELKGEHLTYPQIAERMGCSVSTAHARVQRALARVPAEAVEHLRKVQNMQIDAALARTWQIVTAAHPLIRDGKRWPDVIDVGPNIAATNTLIRLLERQARLNGMDAPIQHDVKVSDGLDADIERLLTQLAGMAGGGQATIAGPAED